MNTTATATRTELLWNEATRDKYGRRSIQLDRIHISEAGIWTQRDRGLAVVITLPKTADARYLVNVRRLRSESNPCGRGEVTTFAKRAEAIRFAESQV